MGAHCRSKLRRDNKYEFYGMSITASQSTPASKNMKGANAASKKKAAPRFKSSYTSMITEAIQDLNQKKGSFRQAIIKHIIGTSNIVPNALVITKTIKKMIEDDKLVPAAQAGHGGAGSFKIAPQEKLRIMQAEKAAAKKEMKKAAGTKSADGAKKVASKTVGAKKVAKKSAKKIAKQSLKQSAEKGKGLKLMKKAPKKGTAKAKKSVAAAKKANK